MAIKPTKLRAGFILLLFTLLFICSNSLVTEVYADTPEESFKVTPVPFWEINNIDISTSYSGITQDVLFRYGEYFEDFNDISDWVEDANCDQTSETTENGILTFTAGNNGGTDYDYYLSNEFADIGGTPFYEAKVKINTLDGIPMLRFYNVYPADYQSSNIPNGALDNWVVMSGTVSEAQVTRAGLGIITTAGDEPVSIEIDYFIFYQSDSGTLNTSIPIQSFKNHKIEFMIDTDNLTDSTKLEFGVFQNQDFMNYNFSLENKIFEQRDFSFNYTEYNYLRFKLDLKYSTNYFKVSCYDENNTKLFSNLLFENVRKLGNRFIIQSENLAGWFYLYYFTGDVDYATVWTETVNDLDTDIDTSLLSASALSDDFLGAHNISYNRYVSNFQFMRTNLYMWSEFSVSHIEALGVIIEISLFELDGTEVYRVKGIFIRKTESQSFEVYGYEYSNGVSNVIFWSKCSSGAMGVEGEHDVQFAVWRTQDNHFGILINEGDTMTNTRGTPRFISEGTLENFQANITITYYSESHISGYRNFIIELDGFELGYGRIDGVAEPHFSTTWWDNIPFLGQIINAFMIVGDAIILAVELGLSPVTIFLDSIFGAIGGIAGTVWVLFESALSDLGISIDALASDVFGFFDEILNSISDLIDDVSSAITNLNDNFVAWVIDGITDALVPALVAGMDALIDTLFALWEYQLNLVGTALGWGNVGTFLFDFTDSIVLAIPSWLEFIINANIMMIDVLVFANALYVEYGATFILYGSLFVAIDILTAVMTMDLDVIGECLIKYVKVIAFIAEFMLGIISTVLNAIWGILPF